MRFCLRLAIVLILTTIIISCTSSYQVNKQKYFNQTGELFGKAYGNYQQQNYAKAKELFYQVIDLDTSGFYVESYTFLADCYFHLSKVDSGRIIYAKGIEKVHSFEKPGRSLALLTWRQKYPELPDELREVNGYVPYDEAPMPDGGYAELQRNLTYPVPARKSGVEGTVIVEVKIDETGQVKDFKILQSVSYGCDEAAIRAIKMTKFSPARQRGKPVEVKIAIPVVFRFKKRMRN